MPEGRKVQTLKPSNFGTLNSVSDLDSGDLLHREEARDNHDHAANRHTDPWECEHLHHIARRNHEDDHTEDRWQGADDVARDRLLRGEDADLALDADTLADGVADDVE